MLMTPTTGIQTRPHTVGLGDRRALDPACVGAKAAAIATSLQRDLPVLEGFVVTTAAHATYVAEGTPPEMIPGLRDDWRALSRDGARSLVVRSSSTVEDVAASSMAGLFTSVLDVRGWGAFLAAVREVWRSAAAVGDGTGPEPMAVLVQPYLRVSRGGVMFGVDPVTGDRGHLVVEAVAGGPDSLVSGTVTAQHYVLSRRGRTISVDHVRRRLGRRPARASVRLLDARDQRAVARLAKATERTFGSAQDVEWAIDVDGALRLLQSRPVTAVGDGRGAQGPVLGPGPVAETFPDPLTPLEVDLWVRPLRAGVTAALTETGAVSRRRLGGSPVVTTVDGRVAVDLELFGYVRPVRGLRRLDPRPGLRHLAVAWRVGRLGAELPGRVARLVSEVDQQLTTVPELDRLPGSQLLDLLRAATGLLERVHHEEVLAGTILPVDGPTAAGTALAELAHARAAGEPERELARRHPVVLALLPPCVACAPELPPTPALVPTTSAGRMCEREQLRLRARWVQELTARAAATAGRHLVAHGRLDHAEDVALLTLDDLQAQLTGAPARTSLREAEAVALTNTFSPPLPAEFRLTSDGGVVSAARRGSRPAAGVGAGGGRGSGPVVHGSRRTPPSPGDVLVVRTLSPGFASWLPGLAGLVAETGGTLSHLAILARECGVPTVVAAHDALRRFPPGARVLVDGATGEVTLLTGEEAP